MKTKAPGPSIVVYPETLSVIEVLARPASGNSMWQYRHGCPACQAEMHLGVAFARCALELLYCPLWSLSRPIFKMSDSRQGCDAMIVRDLARGWPGADARLIDECIALNGSVSAESSMMRRPFLTFLLAKLWRIARRRRERARLHLDLVRRQLSAIRNIRETLKALALPKSLASDLPIGFVYAISNGTHIKIGWSGRHPPRRFDCCRFKSALHRSSSLSASSREAT